MFCFMLSCAYVVDVRPARAVREYFCLTQRQINLKKAINWNIVAESV